MTTAALILAIFPGTPAVEVPGDRAIVAVTTLEVPMPGDEGGTVRTYLFTLADGGTVTIVRRYAPRPSPPGADAGPWEVAVHQLLLAERIRIGRAEADDVLDEAEAAARAWPFLRHVRIGLGEGRGALESRWGRP